MIEKSKKYLKAGESAPHGAKESKGPKGGRYYETNERDSEGNFSHEVKNSVHGPGKYVVSHSEGQYHLHHHSPSGTVTHVKSVNQGVDALQSIRELKGRTRSNRMEFGEKMKIAKKRANDAIGYGDESDDLFDTINRAEFYYNNGQRRKGHSIIDKII